MRFAFLLVATSFIAALDVPVSADPIRPGGDGVSALQIDYDFLDRYAKTGRFRAGKPRRFTFTPDNKRLLFLRSGPRSKVHDLYELNLETGGERVLLTADRILRGETEELSAEEKARRERMRLSARGIVSYDLSKNGEFILVPLSGKLYVIDRLTLSIQELPDRGGYPLNPTFSPKSDKVACARDGELYVIDIATNRQLKLSSGAGGTITNGTSEFVAQEEMGRFSGYWWSPGGDFIAYQRTDTAGMETMHIMDAMKPSQPPQTWAYPRPGKKNALVTLGVIPVDGGKTTWINWDRARYPYLATVKWKDDAPLTIVVQNREQTESAILTADHKTGETKTLHIERDRAWVNLDQTMPLWLKDGSGFLWTTERRGAWQIELRSKGGELAREITSPDFPLRSFIAFGERSGAIYATAGYDPTQSHVYRIPFTGGDPVRLTSEEGMHDAEFSRDRSAFVHTFAPVNGNAKYDVRTADGEKIASVRSVAEHPNLNMRVEYTTVGEDPMMHALLVRPKDFDSAKKYPVIVHVYGGPHGQQVQKSRDRYLLGQWIADHGFIVVSLDGRGTPNRGREWERAIKHNLIDIPLSDQATGLQMLGAKYPELDLSRVGVYGWSFGGYFSAMAVMRRPDVYHVGVAGAPVCAWEDYDTHYTERYMGLPDKNPSGYQASNVLTYCPNLTRPLLIIHGTADDNVYFTHALKMSNALFRANRPHDFLPLSDFTHMVSDPVVTKALYGRMLEYLADGLRK